jgi:hypothetical protein
MARHFVSATVLACLLAAPAAAQPPTVTNGRVVAQPAAGIESAVKTAVSQAEPAWIGYRVPAPSGDYNSCCSSNGAWGTCGLEPRDGTMTRTFTSDRPGGGVARLEGDQSMLVLLRVENSAVQKIRMFSPDCTLDAGGRTIYWLDGVKGADSIAYLSSFVSKGADGSNRLSAGALSAIAMHGDPAAVPALIRFAREDASSKVRGDALFWLAQRAGERASAEITAAIEQDPDTEVKRRAVFALSQLPKDEGVPLLIQTARTNRNPVVRKQAMFWLGQSRDPRALAFFEEILGKQ